MADPPEPELASAPPGVLASVSAAVAAGLTLGLLFGVLDALLAGVPLLLEGAEWRVALGCLAATVMTYSVSATILLVALALALHGILRRWCERKRLRRLLLLGGWIAFWIEGAVHLAPTGSEGELSGGALAFAGVLALLGGVLLARGLMLLPAGAHAALRTLAVAGIAGGFLFVQSESAPPSGGCGALGERNRELCNVLLIVVDELPTGELGCYGGERGATPVIDALAERGVLVERCYVPSPYAAGGLAALATGRAPTAAWWEESLPALLDSARVHGGRPLTGRDVASGSFLSATLPPQEPGIRGIDCAAHEAVLHAIVLGEPGWVAFRAGLAWPIVEDRLLRGARDSPTLRHALPWLERMKGRRWIAEVVLPGAKGAAAVDGAVGELLGSLEEIGAAGETLVVFTAAHGGEPAHPLDAAMLRVPVVLACTRLLPHGARYEGVVEASDVVPTVLELLGIEPSADRPEREGRSFLGGVLGTQRGEVDPFDPRELAFAADEGYLAVLDGKSELIASRECLARDTLPRDDELRALLEAGGELRFVDLSAGEALERDPSPPDLAAVRTLWSALAERRARDPETTETGAPRPEDRDE